MMWLAGCIKNSVSVSTVKKIYTVRMSWSGGCNSFDMSVHLLCGPCGKAAAAGIRVIKKINETFSLSFPSNYKNGRKGVFIMRRKTGRIRKIALLMLTTGCIVAAASAAYAGAPSSGPASDNRTVEERQMSEEGQAKQESMPPAGEIQRRRPGKKPYWRLHRAKPGRPRKYSRTRKPGRPRKLSRSRRLRRPWIPRRLRKPGRQPDWRKKFRKKRKRQVLSGAEDGISIRLNR